MSRPLLAKKPILVVDAQTGAIITTGTNYPRGVNNWIRLVAVHLLVNDWAAVTLARGVNNVVTTTTARYEIKDNVGWYPNNRVILIP